MLKRSVCAFLSLLTLLFCPVFLSCNFSEPNEVSTVSFVVNCDQLLSRNTASRSPNGLDSVKLVIALRGDYNDSQKVVFNPSTNKAEVSFKNIPVGSSVQALCCMTLDAYLMYVGYSDSVTLKKGENTISLKLIRPLNESILTSQAFAYSHAENTENMYVLYTFKTAGATTGTGNWIIYDSLSQGVFSFGVYDSLKKNEDQTVKSLSMTEYIYDSSTLGYQIVSAPKAQTITPSDDTFKFISESGKEITFRVLGYIDIEGTEASGAIELPITTDSFNISIDEQKSSENFYRNYYKIALKATDKEGNEITDDITWNAKLLYGGKDINTTEINDETVTYYTFDAATATLTPTVTTEGLNKLLATSGPYQLYVTAEYGDNVYSSLVTLKIPDSYYYELSADEADLFTAVCSEIQNLKTTVTVKLTGTGDENTIGNLVSSINCSANLDFSETGITEIANGAFKAQSNSNLTNQKFTAIKLPKNLVSIGEEAFYGCSGLTELIIPDTVTTIGMNAFYDCSGITALELPESIETLGESALGGMYSLSSIEIPSKITEVPKKLFFGDMRLTEIEFRGVVTSIGDYAFSGCSSLEDFNLPETVTSIGAYAFQTCISLSSITLPASLTVINNSAFYKCSQLESIKIPAAVETIGESAFYECTKLSEVRFAEGSSLSSIGNSAFKSTNLQSVSLPDSLETIGNSAFYISTLTSVSFGNSLKKIGESAFNSTKLETLDFPDSLVIIDNSAFYGISTLHEVRFGSGLKAIGMKAFYGTKLDGTNGSVSGIPAGIWKKPVYNSAWSGMYTSAWNLICSHYLDGVEINETNESTITDANPASIGDDDLIDFTSENNKDNYLYINIQ